jgi:sulfur relay (sulfurtransferase) complex TusBCD TusD component (DsrE family)
MSLRGKKLGILLSTAPGQSAFQHGLGLAEAALEGGLEVYLYCVDEAVRGLADPRLQGLAARGLKLHACAYGAQRRKLSMNEEAAFSGLGSLSDLMAATDRFLSFN